MNRKSFPENRLQHDLARLAYEIHQLTSPGLISWEVQEMNGIGAEEAVPVMRQLYDRLRERVLADLGFLPE
jgi:hypothetical protein